MAIRCNLNQMMTFYVVARHGSMAAAAEKLFVSPPAVTMQIKKLEEWLGFNLFIRSRGALKLTSEGENLYPLAEAVHDSVKNLDEHVETLMAHQAQVVRFGAHLVPAQYIAPEMFRHVARKYPQLQPRLVPGTHEQSMERLLNKEIHVALMVGTSDHPLIETELFFEHGVSLVVDAHSDIGAEGPVSVQELKTLPLALQPTGSGFVQVLHAYFAQHGITPNVVINNLSTDIIRNLLPQNRLVAFLPPFAITNELRAGTLRTVEIIEGTPPIAFHFAFLKKTSRPVCLSQFLQGLRDFNVESFTDLP